MSKKIKEKFAYVFHIITIIAYFVFLFFMEVPPALKFLQIFGFVFFCLGLFFLVLSIVAQHRNQEEMLIEGGVYGLVRHPMYLGAILLFVAMVFFLPHWIMLLLSLLNGMIIYAFILDEDRNNLSIFGDDYQQYMQRVPMANPIIGIIRLLKRKKDWQK